MRAALGAVFILPSPKFLLQFYKRHFTRFEAPSPSPVSKIRQRIHRDNPTTRRGSFSDLDDDEDDDDSNSRDRYNYSTPSRLSPDRSRMEMASQATVERPPSRLSGAHIIEPPSLGPRSYSPRISSLNGNKHASQGSNFGRLRIFPVRARGTSTESSKVFNQDFEDMDDTEESGEPRESFRQELVPEITMNVDPETGDDPTLHPADIMRGYVTEYYYFPHPSRAHLEQKGSQNKSNSGNNRPLKEKDLSDAAVAVAVPQKPEPVLLTPDRSTRAISTVVLLPDPESCKCDYSPLMLSRRNIRMRTRLTSFLFSTQHQRSTSQKISSLAKIAWTSQEPLAGKLEGGSVMSPRDLSRPQTCLIRSRRRSHHLHSRRCLQQALAPGTLASSCLHLQH